MSKIWYADKTFSAAGRQVVDTAAAICEQYREEGYKLTLRGLYYRIIATDAFPDSRYFTDGRRDPGNTSGRGTKNCQQNYQWLGGLVADARVAGLIDWDAIEDAGRESSVGDDGWSSPASAMSTIVNAYRIRHWDGQPEHVEAWVEKDALRAVVARAAGPWNVSVTACKGSPSHSLVHDAAQRLIGFEDQDIQTRILYLGDHDPTGLDIPRDVQERLRLFGSKCTVERIALNLDQVAQYNPPPNYAKESDSRYREYVREYGTDCWELDALEPQVLVELIDGHIREHVDEDAYRARERQEDEERRILSAIRANWDSVGYYLRSHGLVEGDDGDDE